MGLNQITVMGRITRDIELRKTQSGAAVATFSLAVDRDYQPKDGGDKIADFFTVTVWSGLAEFCAKYLGKGRMVVVTGDMQSRKYQDKDGNNRTAWEIHANHVYFADSKRQDAVRGSDDFSTTPDEDIPF